MRHILYTLLSVILLTQVAVAQDAASGTDLIVAHPLDYRPYCHVSADGTSQGVLIDWWDLWASKVDTTLVYRAGTMAECIEWVKKGEVDAIAGVFAERDIQDTLLYGDPILHVKSTLFLRNDIKPKSVYEITEPIAILKSGASRDFVASRFPEINFKEYETSEALIGDVVNKSLAGCFYEIPTPLVESQRPGRDIKGYYPFLDVRESSLRPAINASNPGLVNALQVGASAMTNKELLAIAEKNDMAPRNPDQYRVIATAIFLGILALGIVIFLIKRFYDAKLKRARESRDWHMIISKGESDRIEFKSSLRYDYRQEAANKDLEYVIVKTISAFLNTEGGMLFIGVDDEGNILGLDNDYSVMNKGHADGFLLIITNLINKHFGKDAHQMIHANIVSINNKEVCIVEMTQSSDPVFLKKGEKEEFYIRAAAASVPLGMKESASYIRSHWG